VAGVHVVNCEVVAQTSKLKQCSSCSKGHSQLCSVLFELQYVCIIARGCTGCTSTAPRAKNLGPNLQGKVVSQCTPQAEQESNFFLGNWGDLDGANG